MIPNHVRLFQEERASTPGSAGSSNDLLTDDESFVERTDEQILALTLINPCTLLSFFIIAGLTAVTWKNNTANAVMFGRNENDFLVHVGIALISPLILLSILCLNYCRDRNQTPIEPAADEGGSYSATPSPSSVTQ